MNIHRFTAAMLKGSKRNEGFISKLANDWKYQKVNSQKIPMGLLWHESACYINGNEWGLTEG